MGQMRDCSGAASSRSGELRVVGRQLKREEVHLGRMEKDLRDRMGKIKADLELEGAPEEERQQQQKQQQRKRKRSKDRVKSMKAPNNLYFSKYSVCISV